MNKRYHQPNECEWCNQHHTEQRYFHCVSFTKYPALESNQACDNAPPYQSGLSSSLDAGHGRCGRIRTCIYSIWNRALCPIKLHIRIFLILTYPLPYTIIRHFILSSGPRISIRCHVVYKLRILWPVFYLSFLGVSTNSACSSVTEPSLLAASRTSNW